jgi:hypothetical protein
MVRELIRREFGVGLSVVSVGLIVDGHPATGPAW